MKTFGQQLKEVMKGREVTVLELAQRLGGKHEKSVYRWRKSVRGPNLYECVKISKALGVPIGDLVPQEWSKQTLTRLLASDAELRAAEDLAKAAETEAETRKPSEAEPPDRRRKRRQR